MRFVVYGAGAIGGLVGGSLFQAGHRVELIARGDHLAAIRQRGLVVIRPPERTDTVDIPAVAGPAELDWDEPAVVLLTMKSQDTEGALEALAAVAPPDTAVVCAQNGVENERRAARRFPATYGLCVMCPATHLEPGVVIGHSSPVSGLMDLGCFPHGVDDTAQAIAAAFNEATFQSFPLPHVMRWKYRKLLTNLANGIEALCGPPGRATELAALAIAEAEGVLAAAGIDVASVAEDDQRRGHLLRMPMDGPHPWAGGSSWQSVSRGTGSIETDFLNGEIVLLGRLHGMATPVNRFLQLRAQALSRDGGRPGALTPDQLLAQYRATQDRATQDRATDHRGPRAQA